ncbi:hypothetical protein AB1Y20_002877 [Prymnesium parvum]|uniref:Uncharacterized protein n=1 Tax=Prymnesium parvum TaxID=97485 RepID=A0AB34JD14_PRYPA
MGVPSFFRWVHDKFPRCLRSFVELPLAAGAPWSRHPNPNGIEFDNLYVDFNQLVHQCTHPTDKPVPATRGAMFEEITRSVDRLVAAVRPRRLLVLAVDGVAPRAKMNQQRARRFLSSSEMAQEAKAQAVVSVRHGLAAPEHHFDHNAITPGTEFMAELAEELRQYCAARVAADEAWRHLTVVLSDAATPGEGEHKIMEIIRTQRLQQGYLPDTSHVVYGLDADLVMLSLATHEPRLFVLRDEVPIGSMRFLKRCDGCGALGHALDDCPTIKAARAFQTESQAMASSSERAPYVPLVLLDISVLREYILYMLRPDAFVGADDERRGTRPTPKLIEYNVGDASPDATWWDAERLIDDFVLLTFMVGNDFLPHLPTLPISSGGLDVVLDTYRAVRRSMPSYLLHHGTLQLPALQTFLMALSSAETAVASHLKLQADAREMNAAAARKRRARSTHPSDRLAAEGEGGAGGGAGSGSHQQIGSAEWRAAEYRLKFGAAFSAADVDALCAAYLQGITWCAHYYFHGCADWRWQLPYHYAPFAFDLAATCARGWKPEPWGTAPPPDALTQLVAVLPPLSAPLLAKSHAELLTAADSPVAHMFPTTLRLDYRGKKHAWQAVVLLPFIDLEELTKALAPLPLTEAEQRRAASRRPLVFVHPSSRAARAAQPSALNSLAGTFGVELPATLAWADGGLAGSAYAATRREMAGGALCSFEYSPPHPTPRHVCAQLPGAPIPRAVLTRQDHASVLSFSGRYALLRAAAPASPAGRGGGGGCGGGARSRSASPSRAAPRAIGASGHPSKRSRHAKPRLLGGGGGGGPAEAARRARRGKRAVHTEAGGGAAPGLAGGGLFGFDVV